MVQKTLGGVAEVSGARRLREMLLAGFSFVRFTGGLCERVLHWSDSEGVEDATTITQAGENRRGGAYEAKNSFGAGIFARPYGTKGGGVLMLWDKAGSQPKAACASRETSD